MLGNHEERTRALERRPPGTWIYVGDFPTDPDTTVDSPPFENGWVNTGGGAQRLRFRRTNENQLVVEGSITGPTGSLDGTVVTTMPESFYNPSEVQTANGLYNNVPCEWTLNPDGTLVFEGEACCGSDDVAAIDVSYDGSTDLPETNVQDALDYLATHSSGGAVSSVSAADTSVVITPTTGAVTVRTNTLDVIAADHPAAADWSNNSKKITSLANGLSAQDAAAFGQIPTTLPPSGSAGGALDGSYPNPGLASSVAGAGLAETSDVLSVNVDATSIVITADTLGVGTIDGGSP